MKSTIVASGREYEGLERCDSSTLTRDDRWMREFIITDKYRRSVSSCLMDRREREVNCEQVGGETCEQTARAVERDEREESKGLSKMQRR